MIYTKLQDIPKDALLELEADNHNSQFEDLEELIEFVQQHYNREKSMETYYIVYTYEHETENFRFITVGKCYLKDQCISDEQMEEEVEIIDLRQERANEAAKLRQKQLDIVLAKETSDKKWASLISQIKNSNGTMDDLLAELQKYKFPKELI